MIPASIRTNNPGAMYPGPSAKKFGSRRYESLHSHDGEHKIACFDSPIDGAAAQFHLLSSPQYTGRTIKEAITKWCGGFYASTYISVLEQNSGVTRNTRLTADLVKNPAVAIPLAKAMALQEAGKPYPMSDEDWQKAHEKVFGVVLESKPEPVPEKKEEAGFAPDNPLPSPKPETRVAAMKATSRKWSVVSFLRWLVGLPTAAKAANETGVLQAVSLPNVDISAIQGQLNATKSLLSSLNDLGPIGLGVLVLIGIELLRRFMVEDAAEGRSTPQAG